MAGLRSNRSDSWLILLQEEDSILWPKIRMDGPLLILLEKMGMSISTSEGLSWNFEG